MNISKVLKNIQSKALTSFNHSRLRTKLLTFTTILFFIQLIFLYTHISYLFSAKYQEFTSQSTLNTAQIVAKTPEIKEFMQGDRKDITKIDNLLTIISKTSNLAFIVLLNMDGFRAYHPVKENIGKYVVGGDEKNVLKGKTYTSSAKGTLGYSHRAYVPIFNNNKQIGAVLTGSLAETIDTTAMQFVFSIWPAFALLLLSSLLIAILLAKGIIKILHNLEPLEIASKLEEGNAMLKVMREGAIAIDTKGKITLLNDEAMRIFQKSGIAEYCIGKDVEEVIPSTKLKEVLKSQKSMLDEEQNVNGTVIFTNRIPIKINGNIIGALATFRDMTELHSLAEKLTNVKTYVNAMRAQSHEIRNRLHILSGLAQREEYQALSAYLQELLGMRDQDEERIHHNIHDTMLDAFLSSKVHKAKELGVVFCFKDNGIIPELTNQTVRGKLITILGNLIDNSIDAMANSIKKKLTVSLSVTHFEWEITVCDTGHGIPPEIQDKIFKKDFSTKGTGRGLGLYLVVLAVNECAGKFELYSEPNVKTCITVRFPV